MTKRTLVTITVTGPVDDMDRPWIWEVKCPDDGGYRTGVATAADLAWSEARHAAGQLTARLETHGHELDDTIRADRVPNVGHAKERAIVSAPGHLPGTTITGRLIAIRGATAVIVLPSGKHVTRSLRNVTLAFPTGPRFTP